MKLLSCADTLIVDQPFLPLVQLGLAEELILSGWMMLNAQEVKFPLVFARPSPGELMTVIMGKMLVLYVQVTSFEHVFLY